jgi:hypothetical protein
MEEKLMLYFILGVLVASVVWFFVWRNNKQKFVDALQTLDKSKLPAEVANQFDKLFSKYFKK